MRTTEDIKQSIAAVTAPNEQLAITNELLIDIRTLLMAQLETKLEGQAEAQREAESTAPSNALIEAPGIPPFDEYRRLFPYYTTLVSRDFYSLNAEAFNEHGLLPIAVLSLSSRAKGLLNYIGVLFIHELRYYRRTNLFGMRNSGKVTLQEIDDCLAKYNIFLPE